MISLSVIAVALSIFRGVRKAGRQEGPSQTGHADPRTLSHGHGLSLVTVIVPAADAMRDETRRMISIRPEIVRFGALRLQ